MTLDRIRGRVLKELAGWRADVPGSEMFGWGLQREQTLAQGGTRCDFRFRRGGDTKVRVRLPVAP